MSHTFAEKSAGPSYSLPVQVPPISDVDGSAIVGDHYYPNLAYAKATAEKLAYELSAAVSAVKFFEDTAREVRVAAVVRRFYMAGLTHADGEESGVAAAAEQIIEAFEKGDI